jgi:hypothetical protein
MNGLETILCNLSMSYRNNDRCKQQCTWYKNMDKQTEIDATL